MSRRVLSVLAASAGLAMVPAQAGAIVGGTNVPDGKFPSVANVGIGLPFPLFGCTGTLIAPQWVLTAGHCSSLTGASGFGTPANFPPEAFTVTVDGIKSDGSDGEEVIVDDVKIPTDYLLADGYDVSLLHLAAPAKAKPTPVAGVGYEDLWKPAVLTEIVGFGTTSSGGDAPPILQETKVPIVTDASCGEVYSGFENMTQICAGFPEGGKDTCQGDSGGPMYSRTAEDALFVVGATSYGRGCADPETPGVYARVADKTLRDGFIRKAAPDAVVDKAGAQPPAETPGETPSTTPTGATGEGGMTSPDPTPNQGGGGGGQPSSSPSSSPASDPGPATSPAPSSSTAPSGGSPKSSGFRAALAVDRTLRRTVRARGMRFRLRCSAACTAAVRLQVDAATARKLGLKSRTVGSTTFRRDTAGRSTKAIKLSRALVRRVLAAKGATLTVVATVRPTSGGTSSVLTARAPLAGK